MQDVSLTLPDGRTIAYLDLGAPDAPLVVHFHGAPGSRLDIAFYDREFAARHVRVVSPDRPGYGRSSPQPGRAREDWPCDVAALVDSLGRDRFAVSGGSSGGPYVLACAAQLSSRVAAAAVIAGVADVAWDGFFAEYGDNYPDLVAVMRCPDETSAVTECLHRYGSDGSGIGGSFPRFGAGDRAFFRTQHEAVAAFRSSMTEAMRQGIDGFAQDILIEGRPWGFDPSTIVAPVRVLHGETDNLLPLAHSQHTAAAIPTATLEIVPEHGHISILDELPNIAAELATHVITAH
jgi:pimeloyl-ACP methyl ester carboxylesterase